MDKASVKANESSIWEFVAELKHFKPRVWRRFHVRCGENLQDFCYAILAMFRCHGGHLHQLRVERAEKSVIYVSSPDDYETDSILMEGVKINDVFRQPKDKVIVDYDFGDGWEFLITLEQTEIDSKLEEEDFAIATTGKGHGIIDDVGGVYGLMEICEAIKNGEPSKDFKTLKEMEDWLNCVTQDLEVIKERGFGFLNIECINEEIGDVDFLRGYYTGEFFK